MWVAGIVAEYNPFHSGHAEHIRKTRELIGDAVIVVVMSGNFVQRGDIAVYGKRARANAALHAGADLVLELPAAIALSSARYFAQGAVRLLDALGCVDYMSFGSESGDPSRLREVANLTGLPLVDKLIRQELKLGVSYASARQSALEVAAGRRLEWLALPNNILAVEYYAALRGTSIEGVTVKRDSAEDTASALRARLKVGQSIDGAIPRAASRIYLAETRRGAGPVFADSIQDAVLTKLRAMSASDYHALPDASEGLGNRLRDAVQNASTLEELFALVKTKRYALSRIRRMVYCAFLGIRAGDSGSLPDHAIVLASNKRGRALETRIPLVVGTRDGLHERLTAARRITA